MPKLERHGPIEAWIIDDTSFPKKGQHSVGVARQYCGELDKQDNCQVAVTLSIANHDASLPVAYRLYLPKEWAGDRTRRRKVEFLTRRFGKLHMHPASPDVVADHPEVLVIKADDKAKYIAGEDWHSDVSCDPEPPMGSILYLTQVPPDGGGDTMFANMYAYEMLSEPIRKLIDGLTSVHDCEKHYRGRYGNDDRGKVYPRAEHPIVRTHPETGKKCLFVNLEGSVRSRGRTGPEHGS